MNFMRRYLSTDLYEGFLAKISFFVRSAAARILLRAVVA